VADVSIIGSVDMPIMDISNIESAGAALDQHSIAKDLAIATPSAKNHEVARELLLKVAVGGCSNAQFSVGVVYEWGRGVEQDYVEAALWYRLAAEQGHLHAQCNLGNFYFTGRGVEKDNDQALYWFQRSAEQGHPHAASGASYLESLRSEWLDDGCSNMELLYF